MVELGLPPEGYFSKGGNEVRPVHEVKVLWRVIVDAVDGYDMVKCCLQTMVSKVVCTQLI